MPPVDVVDAFGPHPSGPIGASPSAAASEGHTVRVASKPAADSVDGGVGIPSTESVSTLVRFADGEAVATVADGFQGTEAVVAFLERNAPGRVETITER